MNNNKNRLKLISIISPCFNEEKNVLKCYNSVKDVFIRYLPHYEYEHIFSDNNSKDSTQKILKELANKDKRVKVIINTRNYGPQCSVFNSLKRSSGDVVLPLLPVDLQDPPEIIPKFIKEWENGSLIVAGVRKNRMEGLIFRVFRKLYYKIIKLTSDIDRHENVGSFQLIDRKIVDLLLLIDDYFPDIRGMIANTGYEPTLIYYDWQKRKHGKSRLSFYALYNEAINSIISFSNIPVRIALFTGFVISIISIIYGIINLIINILYFREFASPGIGTLITAMFFIGGILIFFIGLLGEYVSAIHSQVRKNQLVIEKDLIGFNDQTKK